MNPVIHLICPNPAVDRTLLIENFKEGVPNRPEEVKDFPGGKSFNVAYSLLFGGVDHEVVVHTILGGENGQRVSRLAKESGIEVNSIDIDKNTRECNIIVDVLNKNVYPIYEKGFELTEDVLNKFTQQILGRVKSGDYVVFSGTLMQGMPDHYIQEIQDQVNDPTVKFLVDTSGQALQSVYMNSTPYLIKINDEEYNELFDSHLEKPEEFIEHLQDQVDQKIKHFIVTLGKKGAVARMSGNFYQLESRPVDSKNPVASGDFFLGGVIRGLLDEDNDVEVLKRGIANATANVQFWYPKITQEIYDQTYHHIKVKKLKEN